MIAARRALGLAAIAVPPFAALLWEGGADGAIARWPTLACAAAATLAVAWFVDARRETRLRTVAAVLAGFREGDYTVRARVFGDEGALHDALVELNLLGDGLRSHRLGELEAWTLLQKVMAEIDAVVLAVDDDGRVRLANDAAARVLGRSVERGTELSNLGLADLLSGAVPRLLDRPLGTSPGTWEVRRGGFRLAGEAQTLLVLSDVSRALRESEREAWRRLIRVMGHEINNSLSPIRSIADTLSALVSPEKRATRGDDWEADVASGLGVIARRSEALRRFMEAYAELARLPPPKLAAVDVAPLATRLPKLERVTIDAGPEVTVRADADQLEQVLLNLLKNAVEASRTSARLAWAERGPEVVITIEDDGPGVADTKNLFVPFFTTKPGGSGIGLALSRQIVEAHGGSVTLESRRDEGGKVVGAVAEVRLPRVLAPTMSP